MYTIKIDRPFNLNQRKRLTKPLHLIRCNLPKGKLPKLRVGAGFCFCLSRRIKSSKESEDYWANETSEEKGHHPEKIPYKK